jgi:hypothetical protein
MTLFIISFILQVIFAVGRTINVAYIAKNHTVGSVASGTFVALMWIVTTKFGIDAYNDGWFSISGYLLGAAIGTLVAMKQKSIVIWILVTIEYTKEKFSQKEFKSEYHLSTVYNQHVIIIDECRYWYNAEFYTKEVAIQQANIAHRKYLRGQQELQTSKSITFFSTTK